MAGHKTAVKTGVGARHQEINQFPCNEECLYEEQRHVSETVVEC